MALIARAVYDFEGDTANGEVSFEAGAEITVLRQDIGEGWWEGEVDGNHGLFPAAYVEVRTSLSSTIANLMALCT